MCADIGRKCVRGVLQATSSAASRGREEVVDGDFDICNALEMKGYD